MLEFALIGVSGGVGLATFYLIGRKFGSDCIP
jgi:hypothetical protein